MDSGDDCSSTAGAGHHWALIRGPASALIDSSYFPPFLDPRESSKKALVAVIQEAWVGGVSIRRVDELARISHTAGQ